MIARLAQRLASWETFLAVLALGLLIYAAAAAWDRLNELVKLGTATAA